MCSLYCARTCALCFSLTRTQDTASAMPAMDDHEDVQDDLDSDHLEQELNVSSSDSDTEVTVQTMKHAQSEPVLPHRPVPLKRPTVPPRPGNSLINVQEAIKAPPRSTYSSASLHSTVEEPPRPILNLQTSLDVPPKPKPRTRTAVPFTLGDSPVNNSPQSLTPESKGVRQSPDPPKRPMRPPPPYVNGKVSVTHFVLEIIVNCF